MADKETARVEAFSDGVFAIAITLLILEIHIPRLAADATSRNLYSALAALWPSVVALLMSFFAILLMWMNHHELIRLVRHIDYHFLFANGFLLLLVTVVPFPTAILAQYLGTRASNAAVVLYCVTFVVGSVAYNLLFASIAHNRRLVGPEIEDSVLARIRQTYYAGLVVYTIAAVVAVWSAAGGLLINLSLWIVWSRLCYRSEAEDRERQARRAAQRAHPKVRGEG